MGVGYPVDVVVCSCLGVDMFDCVFSTRTARFGTAFTSKGFLKLKNKECEDKMVPIEEGCDCQVRIHVKEACERYTQSYLHYLITKEEVACHLISIHNLRFLIRLMLNLRQSILDGKLSEFANEFIEKWHSNEAKIPEWVINALKSVDIEVKQKESKPQEQ